VSRERHCLPGQEAPAAKTVFSLLRLFHSLEGAMFTATALIAAAAVTLMLMPVLVVLSELS
jgi:hypothetical protein